MERLVSLSILGKKLSLMSDWFTVVPLTDVLVGFHIQNNAIMMTLLMIVKAVDEQTT